MVLNVFKSSFRGTTRDCGVLIVHIIVYIEGVVEIKR